MSIIRRKAALVACALVGFGATVAVNPRARRIVTAYVLPLLNGILERAGRALEAGRFAAQTREAELGKLLRVGAEPHSGDPNHGASE
jgi:hypothetical protein